jgi:hypothetical protein
MNTIRHRILAAIWCLVLLLAVCLAPTPTKAGSIGETEVRAAVETWVRYVTADARPNAVVERMEPYQVGGETVAYIAHLKGGGFCLSGADPVVLPVYFYSPRGTYDPGNPDYQYILGEIGARVQAGRQALAEGKAPQSLRATYSDRAAYWQTLIAGRVPDRAPTPAAAAPSYLVLPVTSRWGQGSPYNDQCPELTPNADEHAILGCNATATAQIMYYWKWPSTGTGSGSVPYPYRYRLSWDSRTLPSDPGIPAGWTGRLEYDTVGHQLRMNGYWDGSFYTAAQNINSAADYQSALASLWAGMTQSTKFPSANFGATTYNWSIIRDTHTDPPDAGGAEAAKFNAHVAIAVNTTFGVKWSGSYFGNDVAGLVDHFRYHTDALFTDIPPHGPGADPGSLIEDIQWGRPAGLGGSDANGNGHAWVIDGYNTGVSPTQFHMNLGWYGGSDDWYTLDTAPLPLRHDMMTRIAPLNVKFVGAAGPGDGSPDSPYQGIEAALAAAPDGATLIFKAGSVNTFSATTLTINRPLTLKGWDVTITR